MIIKRIINQHELGLYRKAGVVVRVLGPGKHYIWPFGVKIEKFDTRIKIIKVPGQEMILADRAVVKVNASAEYQINDPVKIVSILNPLTLDEYLHNAMQSALRDIVPNLEVEAVLQNRSELNNKLFNLLKPIFESLGLTLGNAEVKDVILPADLRAAYLEQQSAKLRAKTQLEHAKSQTAVLRSLANEANMIEKHPYILQLLSLQKAENSDQTIFKLNIDQPSKS